MSHKPAEEDLTEAKAPLLSHLVELRTRLAWSLVALAIGFGISFAMADKIFDFLLLPYETAKGAVGGAGAVRLIFTAPQEFFFTQLKIALFGGFILSFPFIAAQLYRFAAPGLYKNERGAFLPFLLAAPVLFVMGGALVYGVIMPLALAFFLNMEASSATRVIEMVPRVSEYLDLTILLILAFGICFQLPVVIGLLARAGLVTPEGLARARPYAVVGIFAVAALLTPPDIISQIGLAVPTLLLYEVALLAARAMEKKKQKKGDKNG